MTSSQFFLYFQKGKKEQINSRVGERPNMEVELSDEMQNLTRTIDQLQLLDKPRLVRNHQEPGIKEVSYANPTAMDIAEILWRYSKTTTSCGMDDDALDKDEPYAAPRIVASDTEVHLILDTLRETESNHHNFNLHEIFDVFVAYFSHICWNTVFEEVPPVLSLIIEAFVNIIYDDKDSLYDFQGVIRREPTHFRELLSCHKSIKLNMELDLQMLAFLSKIMYCAPDIAETIAHDHPHVVDRALETIMQLNATQLDEYNGVTLIFSYAVSFYNTFFLAAKNTHAIKQMLSPVSKLLLALLQYPKIILQDACHIVVYTLVSLYLDITIHSACLEEITANVLLALLVRNLSDLDQEDFIVAHMVIRSILRIEEAMFWSESASHTMYVTFAMRIYKSMIQKFSDSYQGEGVLNHSDTAIAYNKIVSLLRDY